MNTQLRNRKSTSPKIALAVILLLQTLLPIPVLSAGIDDNGTNRLPIDFLNTRTARPIELQKRAPTLEELIQRLPVASQFVQPIPTAGLKISGLTKSSVELLGFNYFIVVDNSNYTRIADIYRDSRLNGKSNFVTADSVIHPYTGYANRVLADVAVKQITPDMLLLMSSMLKVSLLDYAAAQDSDVREDIERNIAYLAVGIKLLNGNFQLPAVGSVEKLALADLKSIYEGCVKDSAIFDREEDFSSLKPIGWYTSSRELENFYRCRAWLSYMAYPISDSGGDGTNRANNFRRSVLLYRSLELAEVLGKPAPELWAKIMRANTLYGSPTEDWQERTLYATDYRLVFKTTGGLKDTLKILSEPFYRTKLMLAIRRQKPVNLGSASIFEIDEDSTAAQGTAVFRLFPTIGEPELPWMRLAANVYPTDRGETPSWPIALLDMYVWGGSQAGNILADNLRALDPDIAKALPILQHCVLRRMPNGVATPVESRRWKLLSVLFRGLPDSTPSVLRTDLWATRRLESAFAAWVDNLTAIGPPIEAAPAPGAPKDDGTSAPAQATADGISTSPSTTAQVAPVRRLSKIPPYHYLDPLPDLYRRLGADAQKMVTELTEMGYFKEVYRGRFNDFIRLFGRLEKIAEAEILLKPLTNVDRKLLANIDLILDKVDLPLPSVLAVNASVKQGKTKPEDVTGKGFNLAIGKPGLLYVIVQNPQTMDWTLARGGLYSYYEMPAPLLTNSMWHHKVDAGFFKPPSWTEKFDVIQPSTTTTTSVGRKNTQ